MDAPSIGLSVERLAYIDKAIEKHVGDKKIAGAVGLVSRWGKIGYFQSFGFSERESGKPMEKDSLFRIYSMTKPITVTAILILYERGLLRLTDPVSRFIPSFRSLKVITDETDSNSGVKDLMRPVTIHDLLTHTSGLTNHFGEQGVIEQMYRNSANFDNLLLSEYIEQLAHIPLAFQPGTAWRYSVAHDVAARIVEVASGMSFGEFLQQELFDPLDMTDTGFTISQGKLDRLTAEYGFADIVDSEMTSSRWLAIDEVEPKARRLRPAADAEAAQSNKIHRGGHGLLSCAEDYHTFCHMLLNNGKLGGVRILGRKTVELMTSNHLPPKLINSGWIMPGYGFGLGVRILLNPAQAVILGSPGEHGWGGSAGTYYWIDPAEQLIGIYMIQFQPGGYFQAAADFRTAVYQALDD